MTLSFLVAIAAGVGVMRPAPIQAVDVLGTWTLTVLVSKPGCQLTGPMEITSVKDMTFQGMMMLTPVSPSSPDCPQSLAGDVEGMLEGSKIMFGIANAPEGTAMYEGMVAADGLSARGDWETDKGTGPWFALRLSPQAPTICGSWTLDVVSINPSCELAGPMTLTQHGSELRGATSARRISGSDPCPLTGNANIVGALSGSAVRLGLVIPEGYAFFEGMLSDDRRTMTGKWDFDSDTGGDWSATCSGVAAPAVGGMAIGVLGALLLLGGRRVLRRSA